MTGGAACVPPPPFGGRGTGGGGNEHCDLVRSKSALEFLQAYQSIRVVLRRSRVLLTNVLHTARVRSGRRRYSLARHANNIHMAGGQAFPFKRHGPRCGARSAAGGAVSRHGAQERASCGWRHERTRPSRWSVGRGGCGRRLRSPEQRPARLYLTLSRFISAYLGISHKKLPVESETAPRTERDAARDCGEVSRRAAVRAQ